MTLKLARRTALAALGLALLATGAQAQADYPNRPITLMVGLAAGGITDVTARLYAEAVAKVTGQRVIVENKTGAGGGVAAAYVHNATPDGYTLLVFSGSQHATVPAVSSAAYDPVKGFSPITYLFNSVVVLAIPAESPAKTLAELHEFGKKKQGGLTFGTPGLGSTAHPGLQGDDRATEVCHIRARLGRHDGRHEQGVKPGAAETAHGGLGKRNLHRSEPGPIGGKAMHLAGVIATDPVVALLIHGSAIGATRPMLHVDEGPPGAQLPTNRVKVKSPHLLAVRVGI